MLNVFLSNISSYLRCSLHGKTNKHNPKKKKVWGILMGREQLLKWRKITRTDWSDSDGMHLVLSSCLPKMRKSDNTNMNVGTCNNTTVNAHKQ